MVAMTTDIVDRGTALEQRLHAFFETKTSCDVDGTMAYFAPELADLHRRHPRLGLRQPRRAAGGVRAVHAELGAAGAVVRDPMLANETSALVHMVDTPELFGGELRVLAAIDLVDGRIVRWVDYWDASAFDPDLYAQFRTPDEQFPTDLTRGADSRRAGARHRRDRAAAALAAGDAPAAAELLHTDVVSWTWRCAPT